MENCYRPCRGIQSRATGRPCFVALGLMLIWMFFGSYFLLSFVVSDIGFATCLGGYWALLPAAVPAIWRAVACGDECMSSLDHMQIIEMSMDLGPDGFWSAKVILTGLCKLHLAPAHQLRTTAFNAQTQTIQGQVPYET